MYSIYLYGILWHEKTPIVVGLSLGSGFGILGPGRRNRSGRCYCYSWHPRAGPVRSNGAQRMTTPTQWTKKPTDLSLVIKPVLPWVDHVDLFGFWTCENLVKSNAKVLCLAKEVLHPRHLCGLNSGDVGTSIALIQQKRMVASLGTFAWKAG